MSSPPVTTESRTVRNGTKRDRAAILLAEDALSDEVIAEQVGIGRTTLSRWKLDPDFTALVGDYRGRIIAQSLKLPIAKKHERIKVLDTLHTKALEAIEHRVYMAQQDESPTSHAMRVFGDHMAPEAVTGLFVAKQSISATGRVVTDWMFDSALVKEIRELQKQAAQELSQWTEQAEIKHSGGISREYVVVRDDA